MIIVFHLCWFHCELYMHFCKGPCQGDNQVKLINHRKVAIYSYSYFPQTWQTFFTGVMLLIIARNHFLIKVYWIKVVGFLLLLSLFLVYCFLVFLFQRKFTMLWRCVIALENGIVENISLLDKDLVWLSVKIIVIQGVFAHFYVFCYILSWGKIFC